MVKVVVKKNAAQYLSLKITGHAYSGKPGNDIVCAAVSTLGQTLANALEAIAEIPEKELSLSVQSGLLSLSVPETADRHTVDILFRNFVIGIDGIAGSYPKNVKLIIEEVQGHDKNF
ncbi:MAG: uncharacterized protein PWP51_993 [Clostridiales bacterium]|jgi:uncharacterized protein YsxB (DUF464 family)|nr:uncharacterized protein [Clostridiales bacterium]MDN5298440.1 uncharacterized protein [Clostridiales bacterium]